VPVRNQDYFFENMRTRLSGNLKLEWHPDDATELSLFGGYYHDQDTETRYEILTLPTGAPTALTATSGAFAQGDPATGADLSARHPRHLADRRQGAAQFR